MLRGASVLLAVVAVLCGAGIFYQREMASTLRAELTALREQRDELARLEAENRRLRATQPAPAELERLRADHVALGRLRAELEQLKARAHEMDRVLRQGRQTDAETAVPPTPSPAAAFSVGFTSDGGVAVDGAALNFSAIRPRLAGLRRGDLVTLRVQTPSAVQRELIMRTIEGFRELVREFGLGMEIKFEPSAR